MIDIRREAVLISDRATGEFADRTKDIAEYSGPDIDGKIGIRFREKSQTYLYGPERARIIRSREVPIPQEAKVSVNGEIWPSVTEVWAFDGPGAPFRRAFYSGAGQERWLTRPAAQIEVIVGAEQDPAAVGVLQYWRAIACRLSADDPSRRAYETMDFVHPDSALGRYLVGAPIRHWEPQAPPIFPFRCNLSQRQAVENAVGYSFSVIEGPPGTGKTETILNLVASIVAAGAGTVGVVSRTIPPSTMCGRNSSTWATGT
jgi:AAA domain